MVKAVTTAACRAKMTLLIWIGFTPSGCSCWQGSWGGGCEGGCTASSSHGGPGFGSL